MSGRRKRRNAGIRKKGHDYKSRCQYHIVLMKGEGIADFSRIGGEVGNHYWAPKPIYSPIGEAIAVACTRLKEVYPFIWIRRKCIMPDHVHMALFVREADRAHLDEIIRSLKILCSEVWESRGGDKGVRFFQRGYHDTIVRRKGQLQRIQNYISDNPRRYLLRRMYPGFHRRFAIADGGVAYDAYGNWGLLAEGELEPVKVSRKYTPEELVARKRRWVETVLNDGVLVSPFIHDVEKKVRDWAMKNGGALILLTEQRFGDRYHPGGEYHDVCSEGRLVMVSVPRPAGSGEREHFQFMNELAARIASGAVEVRL